MITVNIDPVLLHLGHFALRWYGLIVVTAASIGIWVALREARRKGLSEYQFADAIPWVIVGGLIGARLFHVIDHWPDEYAANPLRALYIWEGGLAIWGGVIGGLTALALFAWRRGLRLAVLLDTAVPGLVLGQAIGRIAVSSPATRSARLRPAHSDWPTAIPAPWCRSSAYITRRRRSTRSS